MSSTDVEIFEDEEVLQEVSGFSFGAAVEGVNWTSSRNLILGLITLGTWYLILLSIALLHANLSNSSYLITNERIIESSGLVSSSTKQYEFEQLVGDIVTEQGFIQSLVDTGDITFEVQKKRAMSESTGNLGERERREMEKDVHRETIRLEGVRNHSEVANAIRRIHRGNYEKAE